MDVLINLISVRTEINSSQNGYFNIIDCLKWFIFLELHCADPRPFAHGRVSGTTFSPGRYVSFTCDTGFKLVGSSSLLCRRGQWQGITPRCEGEQLFVTYSTCMFGIYCC